MCTSQLLIDGFFSDYRIVDAVKKVRGQKKALTFLTVNTKQIYLSMLKCFLR